MNMKLSEEHKAKLIHMGVSLVFSIAFYCLTNWLVFHDDSTAYLFSSILYFFSLIYADFSYYREKDKRELKKYIDDKVEEYYTELSFQIGDTREDHERKMHHE